MQCAFEVRYVFFFLKWTFCLYQNLLTAMDIALIILAVLQLCVSITVAVLCTKDLLRTTREVRLETKTLFLFFSGEFSTGQTLSAAIEVVLAVLLVICSV